MDLRSDPAVLVTVFADMGFLAMRKQPQDYVGSR